MNTKKMAQQVRLTQWSGVMSARSESGKSIRLWCKENGINEKTYYYWQRKLREAACEQFDDYKDSRSNRFTEVMLPEISVKESIPLTLMPNQLQIEMNGIRILADSAYPPEHLAILLRELGRS